MTDYLKKQWRFLRMFKSRNTLLVDYRILKNTAKIMGRAA
ncbi:YlcG family protein [Duffyella gerundensis]